MIFQANASEVRKRLAHCNDVLLRLINIVPVTTHNICSEIIHELDVEVPEEYDFLLVKPEMLEQALPILTVAYPKKGERIFVKYSTDWRKRISDLVTHDVNVLICGNIIAIDSENIHDLTLMRLSLDPYVFSHSS